MEQSYTTPRDVFLHLLATSTLYACVVAVLVLCFQYVNWLLPDQLSFYATAILEKIRVAMAVVVVFWPVFLFISQRIYRDISTHPEKKEQKVRKWLLYLTMFVSAITIIITLSSLLYRFLGGELTSAFVVKVVSVLLVAAGVFSFFWWDLRRAITTPNRSARWLAVGVSAALLAAVVAGFFIVGSPTQQRARRFDDQRLNSLQIIDSEVLNYWVNQRALPKTLSTISEKQSYFVAPTDPETNAAYEYSINDALSYSLCATFSLPSLEQELKTRSTARGAITPYGEYGNQSWFHGAGRTCFDRTIDPQLYPLTDAAGRTIPIIKAID